jgi:hypothetical protein
VRVVCVQKLNRFLESAMSEGAGGSAPLIADGTIAQDATQCKALWVLREMIA